MSKQPIDLLIDGNREHAMKRLLEAGEILPIFTIYAENLVIPVGIPFENEEQKTGMFRLFQLYMLKNQGYAYTVTNQVYFKRAADEDEWKQIKDGGTQIKDLEGAIEGLMVAYVSHDVKRVQCTPILRDETGKVTGFGETTPMMEDHVEGRLLELLPPRQLLETKPTAFQLKGVDLLIGLVCAQYGFATEEVSLKEQPDAR